MKRPWPALGCSATGNIYEGNIAHITAISNKKKSHFLPPAEYKFCLLKNGPSSIVLIKMYFVFLFFNFPGLMNYNGNMIIMMHLLTPWCRVLLEKLTGLQLVKKYPAFHGTRKFITALTSVRHLSLFWASPIQSI